MSGKTAVRDGLTGGRDWDRRRFLAGVGAGTAAFVAGCVGGDSGSEDRNGDRDNDDGEASDGVDCADIVGDPTTYDVSDSRLFFAFDYPENWEVIHAERHGATFAHPETMTETSSDPIPAYSLNVHVRPEGFEQDANERFLRTESDQWNDEGTFEYDGETLLVLSKPHSGTGNHIYQVVLWEDYFGEPQYRGVWVHTQGGGGGLGAEYSTCSEAMGTLGRDVLESIHPVERE